ncbi:MAG: hypothetical protein V7L04_00440 [Nostoc sp.]|uniref:hypothetical protein n=1 Tax=Nostoc sp. TaxID=1180 RepID=UPI002FF93050
MCKLLELRQNISQTLISLCRASCYNRGNPPSGSPVAYGGKPAYSNGFTATHWLLCAWSGSLFRNLCVSLSYIKI